MSEAPPAPPPATDPSEAEAAGEPRVADPPTDAADGSDAADPLELAWRALERRWDDDDAHGRFLSVAAQLTRLSEAVARYRQIAESEGDQPRRELARKKMQSAALLAVHMLEATRSPKRDRPRVRAAVIAAAVLMVAFGGLILWAAMR